MQLLKPKNKPRIKSKTMQVKSTARFGKSEFDKAIEKYTNEGWELISKKKVRNKNEYILEWRYTMSQSEIAKEKRNSLIRYGIAGSVLFMCCSVSYMGAQETKAERETQQATEVILQQTESHNATQTATQWTATPTTTNTPTPSDTPIPTNTPVASATPTMTASPTITQTPLLITTNTPIPVNTPVPAINTNPTTYYVQAQANVRDCPQTSCNLLGTYYAGTALQIVDTNIEGDEFRGSTRWYQGTLNGSAFYVHSELVSLSPPAPTAAPAVNNPVVPANSYQPAPPAQSAGSNCACHSDIYNCSRDSFSSMAEARACYNKCIAEGRGDIHGLDNNNDGNICESGLR